MSTHPHEQQWRDMMLGACHDVDFSALEQRVHTGMVYGLLDRYVSARSWPRKQSAEFFFPRPGHDPRNHHGRHMWPRVNMVSFGPLFAVWRDGGHNPYNHIGGNL